MVNFIVLDFHTWIWTRRGWQNYKDVQPGDVTISYNKYRGCTEYDEILAVKTKDYDGPLLTLQGMSVCHRMTPDHLLMMRRPTKWVYYAAEDRFFDRVRKLLQNEMFEPYRVTKDIEDVKWAARMAAHFVNYKTMPEDLEREIVEISSDLCGYEAHEWLATFYGWVIKRPYRKGFRSACFVTHSTVKDLLYEIPARAGVGALFAPDPRKAKLKGGNWKMHITGTGDAELAYNCWKRDHVEDEVFSPVTRNGTFLSKTHSRVSLITCETGEK